MVVILRYLHGMTNRQAAEQLGLACETVRKQIVKGIRALKESMARTKDS